MKQLFIALFALLAFSSVQAQTSKTKSKTKSHKHVAAAAYQCMMKCEGEKTYAKAGKCPVCGMQMAKVDKSTTAYACPMKCEGDKTYAAEGKCPVCNMNLKKIEPKKKKTA